MGTGGGGRAGDRSSLGGDRADICATAKKGAYQGGNRAGGVGVVGAVGVVGDAFLDGGVVAAPNLGEITFVSDEIASGELEASGLVAFGVPPLSSPSGALAVGRRGDGRGRGGTRGRTGGGGGGDGVVDGIGWGGLRLYISGAPMIFAFDFIFHGCCAGTAVAVAVALCEGVR